jgi:hypothetical protein
MTVTDDSAFAPTQAEMITYYLGKLEFQVSDWTVVGTLAVLDKQFDKVFMFPDPEAYAIVTGQIFGVLVTRQAISAAGAEVLTATINATKDSW